MAPGEQKQNKTRNNRAPFYQQTIGNQYQKYGMD